MGEVYGGAPPRLNREAAIKVLPARLEPIHAGRYYANHCDKASHVKLVVNFLDEVRRRVEGQGK